MEVELGAQDDGITPDIMQRSVITQLANCGVASHMNDLCVRVNIAENCATTQC